MRSCLNGGRGGGGGGGGAVRLRREGGGGGGEVRLRRGGGGGAVGKSHSLLKHKEHHGKRVHSAPALSCSTALLTFVRTTELSGLLSMAQHVICRSLSSGRGGGAAKAARGRHFIRDGGGGRPPPPPKAMLDPGLAKWDLLWRRSYSDRTTTGAPSISVLG